MDNKVLNHHQNVNEQEIDLIGYARIFLKYKWVIIISMVIVSLATYLYTRRVTRVYKASSRILLETKKQTDIFFANPMVSNTTINNTIEIIKSKPVLERTYQLLKKEPEFARLPLAAEERTRVSLRNVETESKRDTDILTISYSSESPLEASIVSNLLAQALIDQITQYERAELNNIRDFLEGQVEIVSSRLRVAEEDLRMYKIDRGVSLLSEETKGLISRASDVEAAYEEALTEQKILTQQIEYLEKELNKQDDQFVDVTSIITSSIVEQLRAEVVAIQTRITNLITKNDYPLTHPEIVQLNKQLETAKTNLNKEVQKIVAVRSGSADPLAYRGSLTEQIANALISLNIAESKVNALKNSVEDYNAQMSLLPDKEVELARLERSFYINEKIHTMLVEKYEDSKIAVQARLANIRLLEESSIPENPIKPNKKLNYLVGLVIGLAVGVSLSLTLNALDTKIHTLDDMQRFVELPIFGTIPNIKVSESDQEEILEQMKKAQGEERLELFETQSLIEARLISHYAPKSPMSESYRTLRTNILARKKEGSPTSISLTSSAPKEGKTTTIINLAITLAQTESKVALVDLDLRRPMIAKIFNLEKDNGVSDYLIDTSLSVDDIIKMSPIPNLSIVTSGYIPPNPSEIIASNRMDKLIADLKEKYDYVLLDAPPVIAVTDALILAKKVDMMLLVVKISQTEKDIVKRTKELMSNIGASFAGAIANGIEAHKYYHGYSYYYYYYSNYYYYDETKPGKDPKRSYIRKFLRKN